MCKHVAISLTRQLHKQSLVTLQVFVKLGIGRAFLHGKLCRAVPLHVIVTKN